MGSTRNGNEPPTGLQRSLFDDASPAKQGRDSAERGLSAEPNIPFQAQPSQSLRPANGGNLEVVAATDVPDQPLWLRRIKLVIFVVFCVELGMLLMYFPWKPVWTHNSLLIAHPQLRGIFQHYFTRGAVTGLGLIDVWIGIWAAVQYREKK